jgi:DNA-directed RNA polymerase subunit RPC12/RpoP
MRKKVSAALRRTVWDRAGSRCEYCGAAECFSPVGFHCEHVVAVQHKGKSVIDNLAVACPACNYRKGTNLTGIDELSGQVVRLFHPRLDQWTEHFAMRGGRIEPLTSIGRATARLLDFNSPERIAAREFEASVGR